MPSSRPRAAFGPIPPDFDLPAFVASSSNLEWATRIQYDMIDENRPQMFEELVLRHVVLGGKPLVIQGYHTRLNHEVFSEKWLREHCGSGVVDVRDLTKQKNVRMTMGHYLKSMGQLTNKWTSYNFGEPGQQRLYLKDIDCPQKWHDTIKDVIPPHLFYLNENTSQTLKSNDIGSRYLHDYEPHPEQKISRAGDLMSSLPPSMRAENLMCYIGHEGTYTPCHQEMCASLGQNIMVEASTGEIEDGILTRRGSSIWLMTETADREVVSEYWLSRLGHNIEVESHFAQLNAWKNAPFKTYVVEQTLGDFILVPPLAPHQVWNRGTRTMKVAWNRTTVETLKMSLTEALPKARMVCRDEQYKNKAIIYHTLQRYSKLLEEAETLKSQDMVPDGDGDRIQQLQEDFKALHSLFTQLLLAESFMPTDPESIVEMVPFDGNVVCSYCRCNIFNRFLTCPSCIEELDDGEQDTYDVCLDCYAMGRSCACIAGLQWVEQFEWDKLLAKHEDWRQQVTNFQHDEDVQFSMSFAYELNVLGKKRTLARICQMELSRRPPRNASKAEPEKTRSKKDSIDDSSDDAIPRRKKRKITPPESFTRENGRCHIDRRWEPKWKQAVCTTCEQRFCFGTLFRAFDIMPADVTGDPDWECPSCRNICPCPDCRRKPGHINYAPHSTFLGHNTKAISDARSVESLVDFSMSNLNWIRKAGDDHEPEYTQRMQRYQRKAEAVKRAELGDEDTLSLLHTSTHRSQPSVVDPAELLLDPALSSVGTPVDSEFSDLVVADPEGMQESFFMPGGTDVFSDPQYEEEDTNFSFADPDSANHIDSQLSSANQQTQNEPNEAEISDDSSDIGMIIRKRKRRAVDRRPVSPGLESTTNSREDDQSYNANSTDSITELNATVYGTGRNSPADYHSNYYDALPRPPTADSEIPNAQTATISADAQIGDKQHISPLPAGLEDESAPQELEANTLVSIRAESTPEPVITQTNTDDIARPLSTQLDGTYDFASQQHDVHSSSEWSKRDLGQTTEMNTNTAENMELLPLISSAQELHQSIEVDDDTTSNVSLRFLTIQQDAGSVPSINILAVTKRMRETLRSALERTTTKSTYQGKAEGLVASDCASSRSLALQAAYADDATIATNEANRFTQGILSGASENMSTDNHGQCMNANVYLTAVGSPSSPPLQEHTENNATENALEENGTKRKILPSISVETITEATDSKMEGVDRAPRNFTLLRPELDSISISSRSTPAADTSTRKISSAASNETMTERSNQTIQRLGNVSGRIPTTRYLPNSGRVSATTTPDEDMTMRDTWHVHSARSRPRSRPRSKVQVQLLKPLKMPKASIKDWGDDSDDEQPHPDLSKKLGQQGYEHPVTIREHMQQLNYFRQFSKA